jgi:hypothetical protein
MTLHEAIREVRRVGSVRAENGKLKLRFPEAERERLGVAIEALRQNRDAALAALTSGESNATIPALETWPESLRDLAEERGRQTGDSETAREGVWISWCEWKARELNRVFDECGFPGQGRTSSNITAAIVADGREKQARRERRR